MASLDMSLDDMIKSRRNTNKGRGKGKPRRGRGGGSFNGLAEVPRRGGGRIPRRGGASLRVNTTGPSARSIAKSIRKTQDLPWQHELIEESLKAVGLPAIENGVKLFVSNLDSGVSNQDIRELFSDIGELKRYAIHYDKNGRPNGSAEVVFARRTDTFQAMKRYNNVQLDGKPMKIEIVGANLDIPFMARANDIGLNGRRAVVRKQGMGRGRGSAAAAANRALGQRSRGMTNGRGRGRGRANRSRRGVGSGQGGGKGDKRNVNKSADELDKDLESYYAESMQT